MPEIQYRNRRAWQIVGGNLTVTVTLEGGHIASIVHRDCDVNPLWTPIWPSIEPSAFDPLRHAQYGTDSEAKLLAGIFGHNLCLDLFGGPSAEEAAAGMTAHGESSVAPYRVSEEAGALRMEATFPQANLEFVRVLRPAGDVLQIRETVTNLSAWDRPSAWTQHVSLGPPFVDRGATQFRAPGTKSRVYETDFTGGKGMQKTGADFDWPYCPRRDQGFLDLRLFPPDEVSAGYTATLMDPDRPQAFFAAWHPKSKLAFGYAWNRQDFPWLGRWEENHARTQTPWNGKSLACGMEFGASPMPESRRQMIDRGSLFSASGFRWLPARTPVTVEYCAFARLADAVPEEVVWEGESVRFVP